MDLSPYLEAVSEDLARSTALADEPTREVVRRLVPSIEPAVRLALVQALSDAAAAITAELDDAVVTLRMDGRDPALEVRQLPSPAETDDPERGVRGGDEEDDDDKGRGTARLTVRLPETLKRRAEARAEQAETSLNTWVVQTLRRATDSPVQGAAADLDAAIRSSATPTPRRVTGWA